MKTIYAIIFIFICIVALVTETNILSRVSDEQIKRQTELSPQTQQGLTSEEPEEEEEEDMGAHNPSRGHKHILILATTRTGSSFTGELFNQHGDNMFYLYEPLWHVNLMMLDATNRSVLAGIHKDVLQGLFLCDFTPLEKFIRPWPRNHVTTALFRRESSVSLCKKPLCTTVVKNQCNTHSCGPLNLTLASESCLTKAHRAIKTVRMRQLDSLRPLVEDPRLDVRVIQLVRDPRAILASCMVTFPGTYENWKMKAQHGQVPEEDEHVKWVKEECDSIRMSAMVGLSRPRWLRRRYMLLRYEDVARYPMQKAEEIYSFTGIPFSSQAREWILRNTQTTPAHVSPFSTKRDSSKQVDKWRFSLPYELARVVQRVCGPTMELFGYSFVDDENMLVNRSVSLLDPLYLM